MSSIKSYRKRVIKALERYLDVLDEQDYLPEDYHLDNCARLILDIPPRPTDSKPYVGWLTNTTERNISGKGFSHVDFANLARYEASKKLIWKSEGEARKYTRPFEQLGFKGRFPWCAAFLHWCLNQHQVKVPILCKEFPPYSYALCEAWQQMAIVKGWYRDNDGVFSPRIGDIVLFDWQQRNIHHPDMRWEDHIGVYLEPVDTAHFLCAEGNSNNQSGIFKRRYLTVKGFVRIPEGTIQL
ncbi:CHAP domain-containing protein [Pleurocapsales cyanobacterium LEGE 06147]|nr:CHAP domain-containing protein [Pleurocapsales cyanobacterium LEGE 06147]